MHESLIYDTHSANLTSFTHAFYSYITSGQPHLRSLGKEWADDAKPTNTPPSFEKKKRLNYTAVSPGLGIEHSDIYKQSMEVQTIIDPMLRMGKLRFPEVKSLAQNHFALKKGSESHFSIDLHHSKWFCYLGPHILHPSNKDIRNIQPCEKFVFCPWGFSPSDSSLRLGQAAVSLRSA